ncbi:hypothetical protein Tco_0435599 [Tanacetum coccineum]
MSTLVNTSSTEISVLKQKHDELLKKSLLTRSQFEGQLKEKTKVISDLKVKEGKDIDTMIEMEKQIKFLNEILYKRNQSIQTIHMSHKMRKRIMIVQLILFIVDSGCTKHMTGNLKLLCNFVEKFLGLDPLRQNGVRKLQSKQTSRGGKHTNDSTNALFQEAEFFNPFCTRMNFSVRQELKVWRTSRQNLEMMIIKLKVLWIRTRRMKIRCIRNKARLVASSYGRENGILMVLLKEEVYVASARQGSLIQMIRKSIAFLRQALYGLKQAPRACTIDKINCHRRFEMFPLNGGDEFRFLGTSDPHQSRKDADSCRDACTRKITSGGFTVLGVKLVSLDVKEINCTAMSSARGRSMWQFISKLCSSMWMEDTASNYGFNYNQNTFVLRTLSQP